MARAFFYGRGAALAFKVSFLSGGTRVAMGLEVLWKSPLSACREYMVLRKAMFDKAPDLSRNDINI